MRALMLGLLLASGAVQAGSGHGAVHAGAMHGEQAGLHVGHAWARATPPGAQTGAAYFVIDNRGQQADRLLGVSSGRAARGGLHTTEIKNGVASMLPLAAVEVPTGQAVAFEPGGRHVMLMGLKQPLKEGETFTLTLRFEHAGEIPVQVAVKAIGAMGGHGH